MNQDIAQKIIQTYIDFLNLNMKPPISEESFKEALEVILEEFKRLKRNENAPNEGHTFV